MTTYPLPPFVQRFFSERLESQLGASPNTVASYRDTFMLLLGFACSNLDRQPTERIPYLHLKSVDSEVVQKVESEEITFGPAVGMGIFCEPALGSVDFLAFRDVLQEIEFSGFAIVEQDMYPAPFDKLAEHGYEGIELRPKALSTS